MYLQQFKFEIIHRLGKENKNADALSRIQEVQCFFIGVKNKRGEENSKENLKKISEIDLLEQIEPEDDSYEGESEDNTEEKEFFEEEMEQIRKRMKEIDQNREQREKRWRELRKDIEKAKEEVKILERKMIRGKTITILQNNGNDDETDLKKGQENMEPVSP